MQEKIIFLVGYMGSGKTTVGQLLAEKLGFKHIDLDDAIELSTKSSIPVLFETLGEAGFREIEKKLLRSYAAKKKLVISTGGGCAAYDDNIQWMNEQGISVYLRCHPGVLFHRIAPEKHKRPLLSKLEDVDIMDYLLSSIKKRLPFYTKSTITTNGELAPIIVTNNIIKELSDATTSSFQDRKN